MQYTWLLRAARWARNPPSAKMVKLVLAIITLAIAMAAVERWVGWPDFLSIERMRRRPF